MTSPKRILSTLGVYVILLAAAILTLGPFLLSVMTGLKSPAQFASEDSLALPRPFSLENFTTLLTGPGQFGSAILVTLAMTSVIVIFQLGFSVLAAYAFARIDFAGRRVLFWVYLAGLMVPNIVLVIPLYLMMVELGLRNTFWGLVLPFMFGSPYAIFLLREYFRGIPQDLVDAARIDGAGHWRTLVSIIVPLSKPILATLSLITIVSQWNSFLWPLVITTGPDWRVITVATATLQSQYNGNWTLVMAATTLALVPLVVLFLAFQKQVVRSITISGFK
ncbi:carbohydrate ABC transporter permease [Mycetocola zhadangensis]|uniref:Carbohydrate ABC transporter permease n=1 Tax=Mycetocola zhadangensis TaxID=1164595 RepID=A0A3L7J1G3_9MICO|nr:carbohydrate ABC transporter permease [Mycetocola zhadangensis]RLQ84310.1 carbohydrate ABC transporter permease [Mycetocola zhadangensis]GGE94204.1 putative sugar ABC transporter, permease protein [Mycetocola zhadangensis]